MFSTQVTLILLQIVDPAVSVQDPEVDPMTGPVTASATERPEVGRTLYYNQKQKNFESYNYKKQHLELYLGQHNKNLIQFLTY